MYKPHLLVVLQTHSLGDSQRYLNIVTQERFVKAPKAEVTRRCSRSLVDTMNYAKELLPDMEFELVVFDDHSDDMTIQELHKNLNIATFKTQLIHLETHGIMPSILRCYEHGRDFYLVKTTKGQYANYSSSKWAMKERALTEDELAAVAQFGLYNLEQFLPKKPDDAHLKAIMEMFEASVNEELYDVDRWGNFYRPNGMRSEGSNGSGDAGTGVAETPAARTEAPVTPTVTASSILNKIAKPAVTETAEPAAAPAASTDKAKPQTPDEIIAAIRRRQQQK